MRIIIAGDFVPRDRVAQLLDNNQYEIVLGEVRSVIQGADYSVVNLECPISDNRSLLPIRKVGPNLLYSNKGVEAIKWAGFNCVTLANNHICDFGNEGVKNTLNSLKDHNMDFVGGGMNITEASRTFYKTIKGQRLAIINCCEHEFSIATDSTAGSNPLNAIQQYYAIYEAKSNADKVLVIVHGGHEHFQLPSPRMVETYRFFIDAGADAVVNHHQHCYSGYEVYKGKPIIYGLGNFCFDNPSKRSGIWTEGYMASIDFSGNNPSFDIHPYRQCAAEPRIELLPKDAFNEQLDSLNKTISDKMALKEQLNKYYTSCETQYSNMFEPVQNRFYLAAKKRGWLPSMISKSRKLIAANYIICEAHRDKLIHWLSK